MSEGQNVVVLSSRLAGGEFKKRNVKMLAISCDPLESHQVRYMPLLLKTLSFATRTRAVLLDDSLPRRRRRSVCFSIGIVSMLIWS